MKNTISFLLKINNILNFKIRKRIFILVILHLIVFLIELFFNYWHYKFSYKVFLSKDLNGIYLYFAIYAILAVVEIFIKSEIFSKNSHIILLGREMLYDEIKNIKFSKDKLNCQRISEDIKELFELLLDIVIPSLFAILSIPFYIGIVLYNTNIYILLFSLFYCFVANFSIFKLDNDLIEVESSIENLEGKFRKDLVLKFEGHSEIIPELEEIKIENNNLIKKKKILKNRNNIILKAGSFIKYILPMSLYLRNAIQFPVLGQMANAIGNLFENSNILIIKREKIIKLYSVIERLRNIF